MQPLSHSAAARKRKPLYHASRGRLQGWIFALSASAAGLLLSVGSSFGQLLVTDGNFTNPSNAAYTGTFAGAGSTMSQWRFGTNDPLASGSVGPATVAPGTGILLTSPRKNDGANNAEAYVQQSITLPTTGLYRLTFSLANTTVNAEAFLNGASLGIFSNGTSSYLTQSVLLNGLSGANVLRFETDRAGSNAQQISFNLNNVSVTAATPEPSSVITGVIVLSGVLIADRRRIRALATDAVTRCRKKTG